MSFVQLPDRLAVRAITFALIGVANSVAGIAVIVIAGLLGVGPLLANVLGYALGLLISFKLNSRVTFSQRPADRATILRFLAAFIIAFIVNLAVVKIVTHYVGSHHVLGSLAGTPIYMVIFYLLCEYWVFRLLRKSGHADTDADDHAPH